MTNPDPTQESWLTQAEYEGLFSAPSQTDYVERLLAKRVAAARADERRKVAEEIAADIEYQCPATGANAARVARAHATARKARHES